MAVGLMPEAEICQIFVLCSLVAITLWHHGYKQNSGRQRWSKAMCCSLPVVCRSQALCSHACQVECCCVHCPACVACCSMSFLCARLWPLLAMSQSRASLLSFLYPVYSESHRGNLVLNHCAFFACLTCKRARLRYNFFGLL